MLGPLRSESEDLAGPRGAETGSLRREGGLESVITRPAYRVAYGVASVPHRMQQISQCALPNLNPQFVDQFTLSS